MIDEDSLRMAVLADHLDEVDYYALLELPHDADADTVRGAFHSFALRFHPDQHGGDPHAQAQALKIFKRGAEAYRVLMHGTLRKRYDGALAGGAVRLATEALQAPASADAEIPREARVFFEKAEACLARGDLAGARMHLGLARNKGVSPAFDALAARIESVKR